MFLLLMTLRLRRGKYLAINVFLVTLWSTVSWTVCPLPATTHTLWKDIWVSRICYMWLKYMIIFHISVFLPRFTLKNGKYVADLLLVTRKHRPIFFFLFLWLTCFEMESICWKYVTCHCSAHLSSLFSFLLLTWPRSLEKWKYLLWMC